MTGMERFNWIKQFPPHGIKIFRLDSQEMLIEWDMKQMHEFDFSDGWFRAVRDEGYAIEGMSKVEGTKMRIHFLAILPVKRTK